MPSSLSIFASLSYHFFEEFYQEIKERQRNLEYFFQNFENFRNKFTKMPKVVKSLNIEKTYDRNDQRVLYDERLTDNNCNVIRRSVIVEKTDTKEPKRHQGMVSRMDTQHFDQGFHNFYDVRYNDRRRETRYLPMMDDRELLASRSKNEKLEVMKKIEALKKIGRTAKRVVREKNRLEAITRTAFGGSC